MRFSSRKARIGEILREKKRQPRSDSLGRLLPLAGASAFVGLLVLASNAGAFAVMKPAYTAGCQGQTTGTKIGVSVGNVGGGTYTYSNTNGRSTGPRFDTGMG